MKHYIYKKDLHWWELQTRFFMSYEARWQSSQWQSHLMSSVTKTHKKKPKWGCGRMGKEKKLAGNAIITTISLDTGTPQWQLVTVSYLTRQPSWQGIPLGFVMSGRTAQQCPGTAAPLMINREQQKQERSPCPENKPPSSITNDHNAKVKTPALLAI